MAWQPQGQPDDDATHEVDAPTIDGLMALVTAPRVAGEPRGSAPLAMTPMPHLAGLRRRAVASTASANWLQTLFVGLRRGLRQG